VLKKKTDDMPPKKDRQKMEKDRRGRTLLLKTDWLIEDEVTAPLLA